MAVQVQKQLHGVNVTDLERLVEEGEDKEFAVRRELKSHHFVCSLNFLIELELNITSLRALSQGVELDSTIS